MTENHRCSPERIAERTACGVSAVNCRALTLPTALAVGSVKEEITGFSQGAVFVPMIGAIPFIGYVFALEDGQDVEAFLQKLEKCADLRWNVCTQAEEIAKGAVGQTVCFVMSPLEFEE